ncbi:MAG: hypothetical protein FJX72_13170 [Armatimonadetes bacterium]|nr:hypothetical protein [Armatimonadota bacterium]
MPRTSDRAKPVTWWERWAEELLVRTAVGIGTAILAVAMTPLLFAVFSLWWYVAAAALGFLVGFIGGGFGRSRDV